MPTYGNPDMEDAWSALKMERDERAALLRRNQEPDLLDMLDNQIANMTKRGDRALGSFEVVEFMKLMKRFILEQRKC